MQSCDSLGCRYPFFQVVKSPNSAFNVRSTSLLFLQGLYGVVCHNSKLLGPVLKLLLTQLQIYVDSDEDAQPPIKLEPTIVTQGEKVVLVEPMARFVSIAILVFICNSVFDIYNAMQGTH